MGNRDQVLGGLSALGLAGTFAVTGILISGITLTRNQIELCGIVYGLLIGFSLRGIIENWLKPTPPSAEKGDGDGA